MKISIAIILPVIAFTLSLPAYATSNSITCSGGHSRLTQTIDITEEFFISEVVIRSDFPTDTISSGKSEWLDQNSVSLIGIGDIFSSRAPFEIEVKNLAVLHLSIDHKTAAVEVDGVMTGATFTCR